MKLSAAARHALIAAHVALLLGGCMASAEVQGSHRAHLSIKDTPAVAPAAAPQKRSMSARAGAQAPVVKASASSEAPAASAPPARRAAMPEPAVVKPVAEIVVPSARSAPVIAVERANEARLSADQAAPALPQPGAGLPAKSEPAVPQQLAEARPQPRPEAVLRPAPVVRPGDASKATVAKPATPAASKLPAEAERPTAAERRAPSSADRPAPAAAAPAPATVSTPLPAPAAQSPVPAVPVKPAAPPKVLPPAQPAAAAKATPPAVAQPTVAPGAPPSTIGAQIERAELLLRIGNVQGAREVIDPGVKAKSPEALTELAKTYDPIELQRFLVPPGTADAAKAIEIYTEAARLGSSVAKIRLDRLKAQSAPAPEPQKK